MLYGTHCVQLLPTLSGTVHSIVVSIITMMTDERKHTVLTIESGLACSVRRSKGSPWLPKKIQKVLQKKLWKKGCFFAKMSRRSVASPTLEPFSALLCSRTGHKTQLGPRHCWPPDCIAYIPCCRILVIDTEMAKF